MRLTIVAKRFCLSADARDDFTAWAFASNRNWITLNFSPASYLVSIGNSDTRWVFCAQHLDF